MADETELAKLRQQIDSIDAQLVDLLNQRAEAAVKIGHAKQGGPIYRPEREAQVLKNVASANTGPLPEAGLILIFHVIMATCRDLQLK
jgi:chorismate mutase / prephenate dehydratase